MSDPPSSSHVASTAETPDARPVTQPDVDAATAAADRALVAALRQGDEAAFMRLVEMLHATLLRLAQVYVSSREAAEDVVQETWLAVLQSLGQFAGRSSLKTWIMRILVNRAKTRAERDGRSVPFSALAEADGEDDGPSVAADRFLPSTHLVAPNQWAAHPQDWGAMPEARLLSQETLARVEDAITALPTQQRAVITLRDVEGLPAEECCSLLGITLNHQRVLLHRARSR
ncbi:MAG TPA: sigma-70 family RNA polymerase sigma factor, partial [Ktedonobacterales bacterium]|nr:sigma-70 family RNA polymerase sigma factor [Ktedonobacterales bacterium]